MTHHAKAPSAGSTQATGKSRGLFRRAFATRGASRGSEGSGARSHRRLPLAVLTAFALFASLAFASSASATPTATIGAVSQVSYASAHVDGVVNPNGLARYNFEYCADGLDCTEDVNWTPVGGEAQYVFAEGPVSVDFTSLDGLKGETKYFVRLHAINGTDFEDDSFSALPYPSFTTLAVDPPTIPGAVGASPIFSTSATATGTVKRPANADPAFDVNCHFEYISDAQFTANEGNGDPGFTGATEAACAENPVSPDKVNGSGEAEVTAPLGCTNPLLEDSQGKCLKPETSYHLRLVAENAAPGVVTKDATATFTTAAKVATPTVIATDEATDVSYGSAKATGEVSRPAGADPALDLVCRFEYITNEQFLANEGNGDPGFSGAQLVPCAENPITAATVDGDGKQKVSAELTGLQSKSGVTYHLRLAAENAGGTDTKDAADTFTTLPGGDTTTTIDPPVMGYTTAQVSGTITRGALNETDGIRPFFEYAEAGTENWSGEGNGALLGVIPTGPGTHNVSYEFKGLNPDTEYEFRLSFQIGGSSVPLSGPFPVGKTRHLEAPTATLDPVTIFTGTTAHFSGTVDTHAPAGPLDDIAKAGYKVYWHFECTPECKDANGNVIAGTVEAEEGSKTLSADAKRLDANTHYEVKLVAHNELYSVETPIQTFDTPLIKPTIRAAPGGSDGKGGYTLQATVNPNGSPVSDCKFEWGPNSADYAFTADCSPTPGDKAQPVTVEAHLTGLNPGVVYHFNLLATNAAGTAESGDQEFIPTLDPPKTCPNEQVRKENNSLALPECRAYERVTPEGKEGFDARLEALGEGDRVRYQSTAGNIAKSGTGSLSNDYAAGRSAGGWETISNLNGSSGSLRDAPSFVDTSLTDFVAYSSDLLSSIWSTHRQGDPAGKNFYLRGPGGAFTLIGSEATNVQKVPKAASADLSHLVVWPLLDNGNNAPTQWGPGVYEFVGTGVDVPRRVDVNNLGKPVSSCIYNQKGGSVAPPAGSALSRAISSDGRVIVFIAQGPPEVTPGTCGLDSPPTDELWARVNGTTSFHVSASRCDRVAPVCNAPAPAIFAGAAKDGSRIFFTTTQQLLNGDTDQTNDLYACDIPSGTPAPSEEAANPCVALIEVSGSGTEAKVEPPIFNGGVVSNPGVRDVSEDGSTVLFVAEGALTDNEDALGEQALAGDHNLYAWRTDVAHPAGQTSFVGKLDSNDLVSGGESPQSTPDGRYLVFTTASQLVETDTDNTRDVYRYDVEAEELTRASTNAFGVAGNGAGFPAQISDDTVSDDGQKIAFTTTEKLSEDDGNGEPDLYLWTPARVSLISTGAVGGGATFVKPGAAGGLQIQTGNFAINGSGRDIYFETPGALTPADGDAVGDVYDARIGGGFSFARKPICTGEDCQPPASTSPPAPASPANRPNGEGNVKPKTCPKGKVVKGNKCVKKKKHKKHSGKKHHGKKAAPKRGGGK